MSRGKYEKLKRAKYKRQKGKCYYCATPLSARELTIDHVIPHAYGGIREPQNVVLACKPCNNAKGDLTGSELTLWLEAREREEHET